MARWKFQILTYRKDLVPAEHFITGLAKTVEDEVDAVMPNRFDFHGIGKIILELGSTEHDPEYHEVVGVAKKQTPDFPFEAYVAASDDEKVGMLRRAIRDLFDWFEAEFDDAGFIAVARSKLPWAGESKREATMPAPPAAPAVSPEVEARFWNLIDAAFIPDRNQYQALDHLQAALEKLTREQIVDFQRALNAAMDRCNTWDVVAAATYFGCGDSDDGFEDFRAWLVSRGKAEFERIVEDVNHLASIGYVESPTEEWYLEELHMLPGEVGGEEDDPDWPHPGSDGPTGEEVPLDVESLKERYPALWERFGEEFMG